MILFRTGSITSAQPFPRAVKWQHLARHQDINWDSLSRLSDQELFAANGVEIVISPLNLNLKLLCKKTLLFFYYQIASSKNGGLTLVVNGYCEMANALLV